MAEFCRQCSEKLFGKDYGDLANVADSGSTALVVCEGCGYIWVNVYGERVRYYSLEDFDYMSEQD